jgi:high-affinity iron transporter
MRYGWLSLMLVTSSVLAAPVPAELGETIRSSLIQAQLELVFDPQTAVKDLAGARAAWEQLAPEINSPPISRGFAQLDRAIKTQDEAAFAAARSRIWTAVLKGSYKNLETAVEENNPIQAERWLALREFRPATRFTPPEADATLAIVGLARGKVSPADALTAVRSDLLDAYQARMNQALHDLKRAHQAGFVVRQAELAALAAGYFDILATQLTVQRGEWFWDETKMAFARLQGASDFEPRLARVEKLLEGFRAAPLSPRERAKRAGQTLRFLSLVPLEYGRGAKGAEGEVQITKDLEITEAITFRNSAAAAWADLEPLLVEDHRAAVGQIKLLLAQLESRLEAALKRQNPPTPGWVQQTSQTLLSILELTLPKAWLRANPSGDIEVIRSQIRAVENAVAAGNLEQAELARLDAYALLESGAEARLRVFAPQLALDLEALFWNGTAPKGLARLIREQASPDMVRLTRKALEGKLSQANRILGRDTSPTAILSNAAIIVLREGMEAVLILAALLASFKRRESQHLRRPVWLGVGLAFVASMVTWIAMQGALTQFARYGEKVEAVVSVIAIGILMLIMNWFYHSVYWTDNLAGFHQQKQTALQKNGTAAFIGLTLLGFESIYREGFETVLFLQSLILQSNNLTVALGTAIGLAATVLLGLLVFALQVRLPHKKMLMATGLLIVLVLFTLVGQTTHVMQVVGWFPIHPLGLSLPYWLGTWFGVYPTLEGLLLQLLVPSVILGSYFAAEGLKRRRLQAALNRQHQARSR